MNNDISIIIPVYNGENYIHDALNSVTQQSYPIKEIIVVDDGSSDSTKAIIANYKIKNTLLTYIFQINSGISAARNAGLYASKTSFVAFLDHDDLYLPVKLESAMKIFSTNANIMAVRGKHKLFFEGIGLDDSDHLIKDKTKQIDYGPLIGAAVFKKILFEKIGYFDEDLISAEDIDLWLRIRKNNLLVHDVDEVHLLYRRHKDNYTKTKKFNKSKGIDLLRMLRKNKK